MATASLSLKLPEGAVPHVPERRALSHYPSWQRPHRHCNETCIEYPCHFDELKKVDCKNWAVTLIASEGTGLSKHHAQLLVEMVKAGKYYKCIIDLIGGGSCRSETGNRIQGSWCNSYFGKLAKVQFRTGRFSSHLVPIRHSGHSETWIRSSEQVSAMLKTAWKESKDPLAHPRPFSLFGRSSAVTKSMKVYAIYDPSLKAMYMKRPKFITSLFELVEEIKKAKKRGRYSYSSVSRKIMKIVKSEFLKTVWGLHTTMHMKLYDYFSLLESEHYELDDRVKAQAYQAFRSVFIRDQERWLYQRIEHIMHLILRGGMKKRLLQQDSCMTWARDKLRMVDVELSDSGLNRVITDTRRYIHRTV